ncbi:hypothetical protein EZS27_043003, partial [termite gut metagenome]
KIMPNANILQGTRIGNGNVIFPGAVIGAIPQDLKFHGEETTAEIGNNNTIRENVTINRGTAAKGRTILGNNNLLMEGVHIAHDSLIGNGCIIGNSTKMAGEVVIDDNAILSAGVLMHQFCRVGGYVMVQGGTRFGKDVPPYIIAGREPVIYCYLFFTTCAINSASQVNLSPTNAYPFMVAIPRRIGVSNSTRKR